MAHLIIALGEQKKKFEIKGEFFFIGRGEGNQIRLKDPKVSEQHCQILCMESGYRILDLGSEIGTLVNGEKITQVDLKEGDVIQVGKIQMTLKGVEAAASPAQPPAGAPTGRPVRVVGPGGARRKTRKKEKVPIQVSKEMAAASQRGGDRLVRRQLRKGSKIPAWAQAVIAFWAVVIIIFVGYLVIKAARPSPYHDQFLKAQNFITQNQPDLAFLAFQQIPPDDPKYGEMAQKELKRLEIEREAGLKTRNIKGAMEYFAHNIELFIHKFIDAPEDKRTLARTIARDYAADRNCYIRALIVRRIDYYLSKYEGCPDTGKVKALRKKYAKEIDLNATPDYRDIEVEADTELNLKHYGNAYQIMTGYLNKYPDTQFKSRIEDMLDVIWGSVKKEWDFEKNEVKRKEDQGSLPSAIRDLNRMIRLCDGIESTEGKELIAYWEDWKSRINAKIDSMAGVERRTEIKN